MEINFQIEKCFLGCLLASDKAYDDHMPRIRQEFFYSPVHARIFEAIRERYDTGKPVGVSFIAPLFSNDLDLTTVGGSQYIRGLADCVITTMPSTVNGYAEKIYDEHSRRAAHALSEQIAAVARKPEFSAKNDLSHIETLTLNLAAGLTEAGKPSAKSDISQCCISRWAGKKPPDLAFTIQRIAPKGMVTLLVAEGGMGKSMFLQQACAAIPLGKDLCGLSTSSGTAAGVFAEDSDAVLHNRQFRICEALRADVEELTGRVFILPQIDADLRLWHDGNPTAFMRQLEKNLAKIPELQLLTLDNVALLFSGDENNRIEVTAFISHLNKLAARLNIAIILSTHSSKSQDGSTLRLASGSTAWINASRSVIELNKKNAGDESPTLHLRKANHSRPGEIAELAWQDGVLIMPASASPLEKSVRSSQIRQRIIQEVKKRQDTGNILSSSHQSTGRYLPKVLKVLSPYKERELKLEMEKMMAEEILIPYQKSARSAKGLACQSVYAEKDQSAYGEEIRA